MGDTIPVGGLDSAISEMLAGYDAEARAAVIRAVDRTAKATNREISKHAKFEDQSGAYRKSFALKKGGDRKTSYSVIWHVKGRQFRLTHLLEHGHMNRDGTRARAFPHITYGDKLAQRMLPEQLEKELSK